MNTPTEIMWRFPVAAHVPAGTPVATDWEDRRRWIERYVLMAPDSAVEDPWAIRLRAAKHWDLNRERDR